MWSVISITMVATGALLCLHTGMSIIAVYIKFGWPERVTLSPRHINFFLPSQEFLVERLVQIQLMSLYIGVLLIVFAAAAMSYMKE